MANISLKSLANYESVSSGSFLEVLNKCPAPPPDNNKLSSWNEHTHILAIPIKIYHFNGFSTNSLYNDIMPQATGDYVEIISDLETKTINGLYNSYNDNIPLTINVTDKDSQTIKINIHKTSGMGYASSLEAYSIGEFMNYENGYIGQQFSAIQWERYAAFNTYFMRWIYATPIKSFWANIPVKVTVNYNTANARVLNFGMSINYNPA